MLRFKIFLILTLFSLIFILVSCSSPTESSKGSLTGTINLEGEADHSGITIALYNLAYLDTTIVRINNQYPQLGVHINQHTEFDHRLQTPVKYTETSVDGSFELTKISTDRYNIVAFKDGWGFKYLYEIEISKGDNDIHQQLILFEEQHISGNIQDNITVETDHHLIVDADTDFAPGTSLTILPGAIIRINPGDDLTIYGTLTAHGEENNMFWVTSNDGFDSSLIYNIREELLPYNSIELSPIASVSDNLIEWGKFDYANTCLQNYADNLNIRNGIFRDGNGGLQISYANNCNISKVTSLNFVSENFGGVYYIGSSNNTIMQSIIMENNTGIRIHSTQNTEISNNYITHCNLGVYNLINSENTLVVNNEFIEIDTAVLNIGNSSVSVLYNLINSNIGVRDTYMASYPYNAYSYVNNNNFSCSEFAVKVECVFTGGVIVHLDAENNWWNTSEETEIQALIWDRNDEDPLDPHYDQFEIFDYSPYRSQTIQNAGIQ